MPPQRVVASDQKDHADLQFEGRAQNEGARQPTITFEAPSSNLQDLVDQMFGVTLDIPPTQEVPNPISQIPPRHSLLTSTPIQQPRTNPFLTREQQLANATNPFYTSTVASGDRKVHIPSSAGVNKTKMLGVTKSIARNPYKEQISQKLSSIDLIAPKTLDFKNYFQKKQFKIQQAFMKPEQTASFIDLQQIYESDEVQQMLVLSSEHQQHRQIIQVARNAQQRSVNPFENPFAEHNVSTAGCSEEEIMRRRRIPESFRRQVREQSVEDTQEYGYSQEMDLVEGDYYPMHPQGSYQEYGLQYDSQQTNSYPY
ncbi:hypothetical protein FGO68_gene11308 [Halteria grandinella]|uniref:Uncharacterized protein n=1 Tax=Halteria grandinella TaxID=5974 RepID=A0A8J8T465_HALGN|nr:hypothetical protein FGO68_gene11308 [Halteria grandinella]